MLTLLLPNGFEEEELKALMQQIEAECEAVHVQIIGGHTEVTRVVNQPVVSVCGVGKVKKGKLVTTGGVKPDMDIIVTKWIALEGTSILAKEKEALLRERFSEKFLESAKRFDAYLSVMDEAAAGPALERCTM